MDGILARYGEAVRLKVRSQDLFHLPVHYGHLSACPVAEFATAKEQVEEPTEDRKNQDGHNPGDFIGGLSAPASDPKNGILVPAWDFFGGFESTYEGVTSINNMTYQSYLTINAIDGSIIDRNLGY